MRKHRITITIDMSLLSREVQDKASRLMTIIRSSKNSAETSDITENTDLMSRAISYAASEIMSMCKEYIWSDQHTTSNKMLNSGNIKMILIMPLCFNLAGCTPLGQMMHAYIVARALSEWLRYTSPELMEPQMSICLETSRNITNILNDRVPRYRVGQDVELIVGDVDITMLTSLSMKCLKAYLKRLARQQIENTRRKWAAETSRLLLLACQLEKFLRLATSQYGSLVRQYIRIKCMYGGLQIHLSLVAR